MVEGQLPTEMQQPPMAPGDFGGEESTGMLGLQQYWLMIRSRIWILVVIPALFVGAAVFYLKSAVPVYQASSRLLVETGDTRLLRIDDIYDPTAGRSMDAFISTQLQLMQTQDMLTQAFEDLGLAEWPAFAKSSNPIGILRGNLSLTQESRTFLVRLTYRSPDPKLAARMANTLSDFYVRKFAEDTTHVSNQGLEQLRSQLQTLANAREQAREAVIKYKTDNNLIDPDTARELIATQMQAITTARVEAQMAETEQNSLYTTLTQWQTKGDDQSLAAVANSLPDSLITTFRTEIIRARAQLPDLLSRFGPSHAAVKTQKEIIQNFEDAMRSEIEVSLRRAKMDSERATERRKLLDKEMQDLQDKSLAVDRSAGEFQVLQDTLTATESSYRMVLQRINEVELSVGPQQEKTKGSLSIREHARVPGGPVWPSRPRILGMALFLGLASAAGLNILLCLLNNTAKSAEEIRAITSFPYLGDLAPLREDETELSSLEKPRGAMAESFRTICTSLRLSLTSRSHRCFAVTSADAGEGKTFAAFNLSLALARDGMRVLLIEADMRRPRMRKIIDQAAGDSEKPGKIGLSSVLVGDCTLERGRWVLPAEPRLHVLLCGVVPPNPAELLGGERFSELLEQTRQEYDMVIIDTPPVLHVADSCIIAGKGVAMIYVTRLFNTPAPDIAHGARQLKMVSATVVGALVNEADLAKGGKGYGYYRYGYYRYGYYRKYGYSRKEGYGTYGTESANETGTDSATS